MSLELVLFTLYTNCVIYLSRTHLNKDILDQSEGVGFLMIRYERMHSDSKSKLDKISPKTSCPCKQLNQPESLCWTCFKSLSKILNANLRLLEWLMVQMYRERFADGWEKLVLYQSLWIINELKQKMTDKIILSVTKFIKFSSQNVISPTYSKLNEFHDGRNPVRLS